jgi:ABC-2 type transport system ATP-binding protein
MDAVIGTDGLTKIWGEVTAVSDLSLRVMAKECYAFLGRNGSGKSTTARMLLDFIRPTRGSARVLGGSGRDPAIRARVGYLPGDLNLPRAMTGAAAIDYFGAFQGHEAEAASLVERFGLDPGRPVRELSTGNRRKVGLVLAFMSRPELLILDEPTSGLDPVLQEEFRKLLAERKAAGASIWLTSHVMAEVERVADRVGLLRDGMLVSELSMEELRRQAADRLRFSVPRSVGPASLAGAANVTATSVDDGAITVTVDGPVTDVLRRAADLGATAVETERRELDDIFLELFDVGSHQS